MATVDKGLIRRLNHLQKICKAGERGFEAVAANVSNRGLKVLLKTYAQQRAQFADELEREIQRLGGKVSDRDSIRGIIHRGRIHIQATLTIGDQNVENFVLSEAILGEKTAVRAYKRVLAKDLPAETGALVKHHYQGVQETCDQVDLLRGRSGKRLVVRLFDSEQHAEAAIRALERAGFAPDGIKVVDVKQVTSVYEGKGSTVREVIISGAVGGAIWGSIIGAVAGVGALNIPGNEPMLGGSVQSAWAVIALSGTFIGALLAAILGLFIGVGVSEEDTYQYGDSLKQGIKLMKLYTDYERAIRAAQIMYQINAAARASAT